jgi:HK97 family phage portal protein
MKIIDRITAWLQNRNWSARDPALARALMATAPTEAGVGITEGSALSIAAVWQAVRIISETVASLPLILYRRDGSGRNRASEHSLYFLLHDEPNPETPALVWRETILAHALTWGNGYAEIQRDFMGNPIALWIMTPDTIEPVRDEEDRLVYRQRRTDGGHTVIPARDVFHLRGLCWDGLKGYSVVKTARDSLGLTMATERFGARWFGSGSRPSGVLEHPGRLSDDARTRLRDDWERMHSGVGNSSRVAILEEGLKFEALSVPPEDAQFLGTRQFQLGEVARWFNLPPSKLRDPQASSYSSLEQENLQFVGETLRPWLIRFEQEVACKLLRPDERRTHYAEFLVEGLLRADQSARYQAYAVGRNWGWLSVNEIRARENLDPIPGGDEYLQPLNMQALGTDPTAAPAGDPSVQSLAEPDEELTTRALPQRYENLDFVPPQGVRDEAAKGLEWRRTHGRGGTTVGVARARDLANGKQLSPDTIRRMVSYFARHQVDKQGQGWRQGQEGYPSAGRIAWALWGGDPGETWANKLAEAMSRRDDEGAK